MLKGDPRTGLLLSYLVMPFMGTDLGKLMKHEKLSDDRIQFLVYQMLKGLKVGVAGLRGGRVWTLPADHHPPHLCARSTSMPQASSTG